MPAVGTGEVATPSAFVVTGAVRPPPGNVALGTVLGSVNMTGTPTSGPRLSVNVAVTPVVNAVPALVVIDVGATATLTAGHHDVGAVGVLDPTLEVEEIHRHGEPAEGRLAVREEHGRAVRGGLGGVVEAARWRRPGTR